MGSPTDHLAFDQGHLGAQGGGRSRRRGAGRPGADYQKSKRGRRTSSRPVGPEHRAQRTRNLADGGPGHQSLLHRIEEVVGRSGPLW